MPYSVLYGVSVAQVRDDFATASEAFARIEELQRGHALGIMILDENGVQISEAHLSELAKAEEADSQE